MLYIHRRQWCVYTGSYVSGQLPNLHPMSVHTCQNRTVAFTCSGTKVNGIEWIVEPYIPETDGLQYNTQFLPDDAQPFSMNRTDMFFSQLLNITWTSDTTADMNISIQIRTFGVTNGTSVICRALVGREEFESTSTIYFPGLIYIWKYGVLNASFIRFSIS